ncbi:hypothetical protein D3C86_1524220 [compost metagenome]
MSISVSVAALSVAQVPLADFSGTRLPSMVSATMFMSISTSSAVSLTMEKLTRRPSSEGMAETVTAWKKRRAA